MALLPRVLLSYSKSLPWTQERFRHRIGAVNEQQRLAIVALIRDLLNLE
jgi:hypothetical protein